MKYAIYYMHKEGLMSISTIRNLAIAADAVCWGALVFFSVHFFTCPV